MNQPVVAGLADPRIGEAGSIAATPAEWFAKRRPELEALFEHHMYGVAPPAPGNTTGKVLSEDRIAFDGAATVRVIELSYGPAGAPKIQLLLVTPNAVPGPVPVILGLSFAGNDKEVLAPVGTRKNIWAVRTVIARGYGLASFHAADIDPDVNDFNDGVHPFYAAHPGVRGPHEWGTIRAWSWGLSRAVDWLITDTRIDATRIATVGHSRMGKAALVAAAFDRRIAMAIASQAGCGGSAPSRGTVGESVEAINTGFPHWFCTAFHGFNGHPERLPVDQHMLVALCAPRPVLFCAAEEDQWANPAGQLEVLKAAEPVYRMLGTKGLDDGTLEYFIRPGDHAMTPADWDAYLDFMDRHWKKEELR